MGLEEKGWGDCLREQTTKLTDLMQSVYKLSAKYSEDLKGVVEKVQREVGNEMPDHEPVQFIYQHLFNSTLRVVNEHRKFAQIISNDVLEPLLLWTETTKKSDVCLWQSARSVTPPSFSF
jgi:hypothetical protein